MTNQNLFKEYENVFKAEDAEDNSEPKEKKERTFAYNPFPLQDAVGERNIKKIWIEYEKLRIFGIEAEELIHKIISKVRDMMVISLGVSKEDLEMKDFPFNKSKRDLKNWKTEELKNLYTKLIKIYHLSRMESGNELDVALEKIILGI